MVGCGSGWVGCLSFLIALALKRIVQGRNNPKKKEKKGVCLLLRVRPQAFLDSISAPLDRQDIIEWTEDADEASFSVLTLPESRLFLDEPLEWKVFCSFLKGLEKGDDRRGMTCDRVSSSWWPGPKGLLAEGAELERILREVVDFDAKFIKCAAIEPRLGDA